MVQYHPQVTLHRQLRWHGITHSWRIVSDKLSGCARLCQCFANFGVDYCRVLYLSDGFRKSSMGLASTLFEKSVLIWLPKEFIGSACQTKACEKGLRMIMVVSRLFVAWTFRGHSQWELKDVDLCEEIHQTIGSSSSNLQSLILVRCSPDVISKAVLGLGTMAGACRSLIKRCHSD